MGDGAEPGALSASNTGSSLSLLDMFETVPGDSDPPDAGKDADTSTIAGRSDSCSAQHRVAISHRCLYECPAEECVGSSAGRVPKSTAWIAAASTGN